jgi:hypothetical protein
MVQATFPVSGGEVVIQWPAQIKEESSEDLKDWLEVMVRRVLRAVSEAEGVD